MQWYYNVYLVCTQWKCINIHVMYKDTFCLTRVLYHWYMNGRSYVIRKQPMTRTAAHRCNQWNYNSIHWDTLSYMDHKRYSHEITYSNIMWQMAIYKGFARITLDCTLDADMVGAFACTNLGNVLNEIARIVTAQTAHLSGNFTHLCGNSMISLKIAANPCGVRVYRGWNREIHCHNTVESP